MEQKRYHIAIASIIFAAIAWFSINMQEEFTVVRYLPVVIENMKDGKTLRYPIPKNIAVKFRGSGWALAGLYLTPKVNYFIDVSSVGLDEFVIRNKDLREHVHLPVSLEPLDVDPDSMILAIDDFKEKKVIVTPRLVFSYHDGYGQVGPLKIIPESVSVGGSEIILKDIISWPTEYKKFEDLRSSVSQELLLEEPPSYSLELSRRSVKVLADIQPFAEKAFTNIQIVATAVPLNREVIFIPPKMDVIVRGGIDQLAKLTDRDFHLHISYQNLTEDSNETVVPLLDAPSDVRVVKKKPERFQFIIRKKL